MAGNAPGLGGQGRWLHRMMGRLHPRKFGKIHMGRPRNKALSMGARRNPTRHMNYFRKFGR
jgi:hypothetical protein